MQEISDEAGINKAMLHYYFRSKDKLFDAVFIESSLMFFPKIKELLNSEQHLFEKIKYFTDNYISLLLDNMHIPVFILNEINQHPDRLLKTFKEKIKLSPDVFINQINSAVKKKEIMPVDPNHLFINLISMCIFPILAKPIIMQAFNLNEKGFRRFIEKRKKEIPEFIIESIRIKKVKVHR